MIVDTMTFEEITNHLLKTTFSSKNVSNMYHQRIYPMWAKNRRSIIKWNQNIARTEYKIFTSIFNKNGFDEELVCIPYCANSKYVDTVLFTQFFYKKERYIAYKLTVDRIMYFTSHSLKRYAERYLGDLEPEIDNEFIGDMLIYNSGFMKTNYVYKGLLTNMYVSTDGAFLGFEDSKYIMVKTFITKNEYFPNQKKLDISAFEKLKRYKKETYGYWLQRESS